MNQDHRHFPARSEDCDNTDAPTKIHLQFRWLVLSWSHFQGACEMPPDLSRVPRPISSGSPRACRRHLSRKACSQGFRAASLAAVGSPKCASPPKFVPPLRFRMLLAKVRLLRTSPSKARETDGIAKQKMWPASMCCRGRSRFVL